MKSSKKRVISLLLLAALAIPMLVGNAFAATDVTASMKKKSGVVKLAKYTNSYMVIKQTSEKSHSTKTMTLSNKTKINYIAKTSYDWLGSSSYSSSKVKTRSKNFFGTSVDLSIVPKTVKSGWYMRRKTASSYIYTGGDWGNYAPKYSITKITKVKTGVYDVKITNYLYSYDTNAKKKTGVTTMRIKKSSSSYYGYVITSIQYSSTGVRM